MKATFVAFNPGSLMNVYLWIAQSLLAGIFLVHGVVFVAPPESMRPMVNEGPLPRRFVRLIGSAEILGAVGVIAPALTGLAPLTVPLAAAGLMLVMAGAFVFHARRGEAVGGAVTLVVGTVAALVAYGRWAVLPF